MVAKWWHKLFARDLVRIINECEDTISYQQQVIIEARSTNVGLVEKNAGLVCELKETKRLLNAAVKYQRDGIHPCVFSAREWATTQRIRDLERENERLRSKKS